MRFLVDHLRVHAIYRRDLEKRKVSLDWTPISGRLVAHVVDKLPALRRHMRQHLHLLLTCHEAVEE
jgi:hypothetical protein